MITKVGLLEKLTAFDITEGKKMGRIKEILLKLEEINPEASITDAEYFIELLEELEGIPQGEWS